MKIILPKSQELLKWCHEKQCFSAVEIEKWSINKKYLPSSARRAVRRFVQSGCLKRLSSTDKINKGLHKITKLDVAWYEVAQ